MRLQLLGNGDAVSPYSGRSYDRLCQYLIQRLTGNIIDEQISHSNFLIPKQFESVFLESFELFISANQSKLA